MGEDTLRLEYVPLATAELWDRNPKKHSIQDLWTSILRYGFKDPPKFEPELNGGKGGIVEGNGRIEVLRLLQREGEQTPRGILEKDGDWLVPVVFGVDARSQSAAEEYGIDHNSLVLAGGDFDGFDIARLWSGSYIELLGGLDELPVSVDSETFGILSSMDYMDDLEPENESEDDLYTRKVEIPIYEPSGDKPDVKELFDNAKTQALIQDIQKADGLTEEERSFLIVAAQRHTSFNFGRIADFYAHSNKQMQSLMEDNALVIIDFDRAIELGFVQLTKNMADLVKAEHSE